MSPSAPRNAMIVGMTALSILLAGCQSMGLAVLNAAAPQVTDEPGLAFGEGERRRMDLYAPRRAVDDAKPLIVFWYGGSWQMGDRADYRFVGAALAGRGAVVVVPDYRLYPQVRFPDFLRDAAAAVAAAQREAVRYGGDPRHTVLGGHSAGAYIAAMLAIEPRYLREAGVDPASIAGFFGLSGPYDIEPNTGALRAIFDAVAKPSEYRVTPQVHALSPPALLVHGEHDQTVDIFHTRKLADALREQGVAVELHLIPGRRHADTVVALSRPGAFRIPDLLEQVSDFAARLSARSDVVPLTNKDLP